jgi:hypothetical protein
LGAHFEPPSQARLVAELRLVPAHLTPTDFNAERLEAGFRQQANGKFVRVGGKVQVDAEPV